MARVEGTAEQMGLGTSERKISCTDPPERSLSCQNRKRRGRDHYTSMERSGILERSESRRWLHPQVRGRASVCWEEDRRGNAPVGREAGLAGRQEIPTIRLSRFQQDNSSLLRESRLYPQRQYQ